MSDKEDMEKPKLTIRLGVGSRAGKKRVLTIKSKEIVKRSEIDPAKLARKKKTDTLPRRRKPTETHIKILDELLRRKCRTWRDYKPLKHGFKK